MLERKPSFQEAQIIRALFMLFVDCDADAEAVAEDAGCTLEEVQNFMSEAL